MIDDAFFARDELEDDQWASTPQPEHLVPDQIEREQQRSDFRNSVTQPGTDAVVLTHTDADGLSSAALVVAATRKQTAIQPIEYHGAYSLEDALTDLYDWLSARSSVYVLDLNPDSVHIEAPLERLSTSGHDVQWFDHHQWDDDVRKSVEQAGVDLTIDTDECTASLLARELDFYEPGSDKSGPANVPAKTLHELAAVTKDRDLWIRDDPRSERLATFATIADAEEYVTTVLKHGPDLPDGVQARIDDRLERDETLEEFAVENVVGYSVGGYSIGITYATGGRSSEIGNTIVEEDPRGYEYDIAVVCKSHGGMGIYSHSSGEDFDRCHEIAAAFGGGGHPTAAGCDVPVDAFHELAEYWATDGTSVRDEILGTIGEVVTGGDDNE